MDGFVLRDGLLDGFGDQLLHLLGGRARPLAGGDGDAHGDLRVLALRHGEVTIGAPCDDCEERRPGDLAVLHEEARGVVEMLDEFCVGAMGHNFRYGSKRTSWPSRSNSPPRPTMR